MESATVARPQHLTALDRANKVRLARAETKRAIARGDVKVADLVRERPWELESITLGELLSAQRRWGRTRSRKFLLGVSINENKKLGSCTPRQCEMIAKSLEEGRLRATHYGPLL